MDVQLHLPDLEATLALGRFLAHCVKKMPTPPSLLLQGDLGSGKTTLVRGFVESLPGSEMAEVSSPSFNIFNLYPTTPPVAHFDLYRLEGMPPDDALFEQLEETETVTIIEWIQFLDRELWPSEALLLRWSPSEKGRDLTLQAVGETTRTLVESVAQEHEQH
ncbi:tRNA (adenosine(37)-N6)-threonylcarbamoyltransferase complex ATPase subunit type 1 TsaE [Pseudodesulfovibrio sp. JC047]|uniref:tRNA (adenosine(37)-N6)-threonylcarbamoyltransferase complex ATPase subunit type 1 TsaE n=1 Tax=Pseudodesulfovibrio sp. JC047 TaxID=2683199 RepID=UPI0013D1767D|nr:tRNA (adenosine(37)-N6)-threonylcarbamoyltransferase complex ATPase subunit type 1 TsaE [Pseudodesulfovibrio sp. JC047]NDV20510.1 tRNA (adenosine(37)-N6)-threonylcarbamoyltransferase complex ATPase subunit type 1 TsaE [Pseudodesulfovibrio sp. JC047]